MRKKSKSRGKLEYDPKKRALNAEPPELDTEGNPIVIYIDDIPGCGLVPIPRGWTIEDVKLELETLAKRYAPPIEEKKLGLGFDGELNDALIERFGERSAIFDTIIKTRILFFFTQFPNFEKILRKLERTILSINEEQEKGLRGIINAREDEYWVEKGES